ncbi:DegV family protein [Pseudonocardia sp. CA-107938]|uniref:DegV family protein n=1 Tax=Pseudonocardia sp. CA-107938 TaxID=3240021 RepID=UPI003D94B7F7
MPVAVVTDSTAYLPPGVAAARGIRTVALEVRLGDRIGREGIEIGTAELTAALADRKLDAQTSRPSPAEFAACYEQTLRAGADSIVSVHLSSELSGTWEAARIAADQVDPTRIRVVDSRSAAMGLGFAVLAATDAATSGQSGAAVEYAAASVARRCQAFFCVDSLDRLRRGGRIGAAAALLGTALAVKPLLHVEEGRIVPLEKVRTTARATQRLVDHAVAAAGDGPADVAVHHLAAAERADQVARALSERMTTSRLVVSEIGAVIGAHVGLGALGVVVVPKNG